MTGTLATRLDYDVLRLTEAHDAMLEVYAALDDIDLRTYRADPELRDEVDRMRREVRASTRVLEAQIAKLVNRRAE